MRLSDTVPACYRLTNEDGSPATATPTRCAANPVDFSHGVISETCAASSTAMYRPVSRSRCAARYRLITVSHCGPKAPNWLPIDPPAGSEPQASRPSSPSRRSRAASACCLIASTLTLLWPQQRWRQRNSSSSGRPEIASAPCAGCRASGEKDMAQRAGAAPFSLTSSTGVESGTAPLPSRSAMQSQSSTTASDMPGPLGRPVTKAKQTSKARSKHRAEAKGSSKISKASTTAFYGTAQLEILSDKYSGAV